MKSTRLRLVLLLPVLAWLLAGCQGGEVARSIQLANQVREASGAWPVLSNPTLQAKAQSWADVLVEGDPRALEPRPGHRRRLACTG